MRRLISMVGALNGEELLALHEAPDLVRDCQACLSTGKQMGLIMDDEGNVLGLGIGGECECCGGTGFHLPVLHN